MGDLRNKIAKQEREQRHREWLARHYPSTPPPKPICCQGCSQDYHQTKVYACDLDRWKPCQFWCEACMPPEIKALGGL